MRDGEGVCTEERVLSKEPRKFPVEMRGACGDCATLTSSKEKHKRHDQVQKLKTRITEIRRTLQVIGIVVGREQKKKKPSTEQNHALKRSRSRSSKFRFWSDRYAPEKR